MRISRNGIFSPGLYNDSLVLRLKGDSKLGAWLEGDPLCFSVKKSKKFEANQNVKEKNKWSDVCFYYVLI